MEHWWQVQSIVSLSLFLVSVCLCLPQPATSKLHSIIERTALFVAKQGAQMEIMIKAKQKFNPFFSFLSLYDPLHPYYRHLLQLITSGKYTPNPQTGKTGESEASPEVDGGDEDVAGNRAETDEARRDEEEAVSSNDDEEPDSDDSDGEGFELHPLLRVSTNSSPRPPSDRQPPRTMATPSAAVATTLSLDQRHSKSSFYAKSLSVNAAPSLERERGHGVAGSEHVSSHSAYYSHNPYTRWEWHTHSHTAHLSSACPLSAHLLSSLHRTATVAHAVVCLVLCALQAT